MSVININSKDSIEKYDTLLQSPYLHLSAAGSGDEQVQRNYLRWFFRGTLGKNHLPKGDYAQTDYNFNKSGDYVKIYRSPLQGPVILLPLPLPSFYNCLLPAAPEVIDNLNQLWSYHYKGKLTYLRFLEKKKYIAALNIYNPVTNSNYKDFMQYYLDKLHGTVEIEFPNDLFFSITSHRRFYSTQPVLSPSGNVKMEVMSVNENRASADKYVYARKSFISSKYSQPEFGMICENGRSIRLQADYYDIVPSFMLYFYDECIADINNHGEWEELGDFALSLDVKEVFTRLEPKRGMINGIWPRFNDNAFVNVANYQDKWNGVSSDPDERNIKQLVADYISLSDAADNPRANEQVFTGSTEDDGSPLETSLLDVLNLGAMDFHVARMLGLGTIDLNPVKNKNQQYVYAAEYFTQGDLEDGLGSRTVRHLYLSLPTSGTTERLPKIPNITEIVPGILNDSNPEEHNTSNNGYTSDGRCRFVTILVNEEEEEISNPPFYASQEEFNRSEYTFPIFGGLEHKMNNEIEWQSPELSNDTDYQHTGDGCNETVPLLFSEGLNDRANQRILYIHKQQESGVHHYLAYGIDIFSRSTRSENICSIETQFKATLLKPPVNINALLIRKELPLLLTSQEEQNRYAAITANDKTLIRLIFDYHTEQELSVYKIDEKYSHLTDTDIVENNIAGMDIYPDDFEIYADEVEIFFRNSVPNNVSGKAIVVLDNHPLIATVHTDKYPLLSQGSGEYLIPHLPASEINKYTGGVFSIGGEQFIIASINSSNPDKPEISVYKKGISDTFANSENQDMDADDLQLPQITPDSLFVAIENMQTPLNWGQNNPYSLKVKIGTSSWNVKREVFHKIVDGEDVRFIEKSRGIWEDVNIEKVEELIDRELNNEGEVINEIYEFRGLYKLTFVNFQLSQHEQYSANNISVEWHSGIVRLKRQSALPNGERDLFEVVGMDNSGQNLVLYINDSSFSDAPEYDDIPEDPQLINYYPGYKVYLYANNANLSETNILPAQGKEVHYSVFGLRSINSEENINSKLSTPAIMFAQELIEPKSPELPITAKYATRPDFFGRASYTLTPIFDHKPNSILFYRSNDEAFLNALYEKSTVEEIREALETFGGNDEEFLTNRWENFLDFDTLSQSGQYATYPQADNGYAFPMPDNIFFIAAINKFIQWNNKEYSENISSINQINSLGQVIIPAVAGKHGQLNVIDFIRETIYNSFVPLTEMPVVYQHIKPNAFHPAPYKPQPKQQNIKNKDGYLLQPSDPEFDIAPMAVKDETGTHPKIIFTDFTLDGTSKNIYFYGVKEMNIQMKMSDFSPIIGPVKLVNSNPPEAPEIKIVIPILENRTLGITPAVQFEINAYPKNQYIRKITVYRALNMLDAQSIRSMTKVKEIDIEQSDMLYDEIWTLQDDFSDLTEIPYGTPLYYKLTVSRKIEYMEGDNADPITEYAPSKPSKLLLTLIPDTSVPDSPVLNYTSGQLADGVLPDVTLIWNKTVNNGKYHVYKMNNQGNWMKIKELVANSDETVYLPLADTALESGALQITDEYGQAIYHHFKAIAENSSGMLSSNEEILTIGGQSS
ncbi:MAG: hypothetical protein LBP85_02625 [Prevotellaceae bacterium]|jgi:hypothetical protein|nr:hypothetical protein [Prevotellaceae bacterium]